jgi:hypothetical protein
MSPGWKLLILMVLALTDYYAMKLAVFPRLPKDKPYLRNVLSVATTLSLLAVGAVLFYLVPGPAENPDVLPY